jgi:hypothetical protein
MKTPSLSNSVLSPHPDDLLRKLRDKERQREMQATERLSQRTKKMGSTLFPRAFTWGSDHVTKEKDAQRTGLQRTEQKASKSSTSTSSSETEKSVFGNDSTEHTNSHFKSSHKKLIDVINDPNSVVKFGEFLERELASENLLFYQVCSALSLPLFLALLSGLSLFSHLFFFVEC